MTPNFWETKVQTEKSVFNKIKNFCASKDTKKKKKSENERQPQNGKIFFANHYYLVRDLGQNTENLLQLSK